MVFSHFSVLIEHWKIIELNAQLFDFDYECVLKTLNEVSIRDSLKIILLQRHRHNLNFRHKGATEDL